jgi:hypothetical protein
LPLPSLGGNAGADDAASGAFFDVGYVDDELLVILQNQVRGRGRGRGRGLGVAG